MELLATSQVTRAARIIEGGGLVVVPTARWYMICCDAGNSEACARIYQAKRRPLAKSLLLVLPQTLAAKEYFLIDEAAERLMRHLWPGDLALRLRWASGEFGARYAAVGDKVALVGQPAGILGELATECSAHIAATSANISGTPTSPDEGPSISIPEVTAFAETASVPIDALIDGGLCPQFLHMTIVDCATTNKPPRIEREGTTHRRAVETALRWG